MKAKVNYTSKGGNDTITVSMKRQVPWWLLLLLPLILLIPINRDLLNQIMEGDSEIPLSQTPVSFSYNDIGVFGARTPQSGTDTTDNEGKFAVNDVREPLWYYLFVDSDTLHISSHNNCPKLTNYMAQYKEYSRGEYKVIAADVKIIDATFTVIDYDTRKPLPDATVTVEIIRNGESTTKEFTSDANGKVTVPGLSSCDIINVKASKKNYTSDSKTNLPVSDIPDMSDEDRTLVLKPLDGETGALRFNLQWYNKNDLDLKVYDPCNQAISFGQRKQTCNGNVGELDVDANNINYDATGSSEYDPSKITDRPQENIHWKVKASPGKYYVVVLGWKNGKRESENVEETDFNLTIIYGNNRIDVPGKMPKSKLIAPSTEYQDDDYLFYEFTLP